MDRYIFLEAMGQFLLGFLAFLSFLLINKLFLEAERILNPNQPGMAIVLDTLLTAPEYILWALPVGVLFATLMTMGRLTKDNELTAMFTNGISLYRLFLPFLLLSSISMLCSYFTQEYLFTKASALQQSIRDANPQAWDQDQGESDPFITRLDNGQFIAAQSFDKEQGRLGHIVFDELNQENGRQLAIAQIANVSGNDINVGASQGMPAFIYETDQPRKTLYDHYRREPTERVSLGIDLKEQFTTMRTPQELSQTELKEQSQLKHQRGENPAQELTDFHLRFAAPFASLAFALVAMPLSIRAPRDERMLGLVFAFLLMLVYYTVHFIGKLMGYNEAVPPWLGAWMMNILFAVIAFLIFVFSRK